MDADLGNIWTRVPLNHNNFKRSWFFEIIGRWLRLCLDIRRGGPIVGLDPAMLRLG